MTAGCRSANRSRNPGIDNSSRKRGSMTRACVIVVAVVTLAGCRAVTDPSGSYSTQIVGRWATNTVQTQFGKSTRSLCFSADHTVSVTTQTQAGVLSNRGTYSLNGDQITFEWSSGVETEARSVMEIAP